MDVSRVRAANFGIRGWEVSVVADGGRRPPRLLRARSRGGGDGGQAVVEFVALLPVLMLVALAMGQGAVAGYAAWSAGGAARVAARAQALGGKPGEAARAELPRFLDGGSRVRVAAATGKTPGRVTVRLRVPSIVPGLKFGTVAAQAQLPDQVAA